MKTSKILAVILAAIMMLTLLTATVFADEATEAPADATEEVTGEATEAPADETEAPAEETEAEDHDHDHDHDDTTTEDEHDHSINWVDIIVSASIIVLAVLAFVICYFAIPSFKEKVKKFFSDYKSELKKVVWLPWDQTRKSTLVVLVVMVAFAVAISLLDWGLGEGFLAFVDLFN